MTRWAVAAALVLAAACGDGSRTARPTSTPATTPATISSVPTTTSPSVPSTNVVDVLDNQFRPPEITVVAGTEVVWTGAGTAPHSVTADDGAFDSHASCTGSDPSKCLASGQTFRHTFTNAGRFAYHCRVHGDTGGAGMSGVVVVT